MKNTIPTPKFKLLNRMILPLEIDMWNIQGEYADGEWHELIHDAVKHWAAKKQFEGKATLWDTVMNSTNFGSYSQVCGITAFGMAGFMKQLETTLCRHFSRQVRYSNYTLVTREHWRPYLHLEHGKIWTASDAAEWEELE